MTISKWQHFIMTVSLASVIGMAHADSLDAQRERYQAIKLAWDAKNMAEVDRLMPTLKDYPLYPYLEYRQLVHNLKIVSPQQIRHFMTTYPTLPPAHSLSSRYINSLANDGDWYGILAFSPNAPNTVAARCNYYFAKWAIGNQKAAWKGAKEIWLRGNSLPDDCDNLLNVWERSGHLSVSLILQRIELAVEENNATLASYLIKRLPLNYRNLRTHLLKLQSNPASVEYFARTIRPTDFTRSMVINAFSHFARKDAEQARLSLTAIARAQKMNNLERQRLKDIVAWQLMGDITPEQAKWRDNAIQDSHSSALIERRTRLALRDADEKGLAEWLNLLPKNVLQKDEWQYWRAIVLLNTGKKKEGDAILRKLMEHRGFYPMVAAQKLHMPYPLVINKSERPDASITKLPQIKRVRELMYWNMDDLARSEWINLVSSQNSTKQEQLARYAFEQNWPALSVQATITGKMWDHLEERFPLAWQNEFAHFTSDKSISQSYAMAIARQESAWDPQAQSSKGASGLMQLMPKTAEHTVKSKKIDGYVSRSQLMNPAINIKIGTAYLESIYQNFGNNRILASAAYNAGPRNVERWLTNSAGNIDAIAFIESIPFSETRSYVKNVLAYDVFYHNFMGKLSNVLTEAEWQRRY
ncbi:putative transglycosylase signal peptide protein [Xenorhabdus indica]|nr:putative transglycosylase signal peptide protein [Xenorhabdus indica]